MAGHLAQDECPGPASATHKQMLLSTLRPLRLKHTPNNLLKWALEYRILIDVIEEAEECAYLAEYNVFYTRVLKCLKADDKHQFEALLTKHRDLVVNFPPFGLLEDVLKHKAVACAAAFLQSGFSFDLNTSFELFPYLHPIDYGALHLSLPLTDLLLQNGADPNIQSPNKCPHPDLQSPRKCALSLALRELRINNAYIKQWRPGKSIFKLLYIFCLPDLNEPFATIKLLASHTKQIEAVLTFFIKMGDVVELAALLMAAKDQLLVPSAEGGLETTPIGQYILEKVKLESEQEGQVTNDSEPTNIVLAKPIVEPYKKAYDVIKIMWKAVDILESYRNSEWIKDVMDYEVPFDIAHDLVNDAKLDLNAEDVFCNDIECLRPSSTSKAEDLSKRICSGTQLRSSSIQRPLVGNSAMGGMSLFSSLSKASSPHHSYHTWQAVNFNIVKPRESQSTHVKPSLCNLRTAARVLSSPSNHTSHANQALNFYNIRPVGINNVLASARVCAPLIWIAKKSIK